MTAWDVEKVTGEFFKRYREVFDAAQTHMDGIDGRGRAAVRPAPVQPAAVHPVPGEEGLAAASSGRHDYLRALWEDYQAKRPEGGDELLHAAASSRCSSWL